VKAAELPDGFAVACLPTEAEWEYACRAGTETEYYTGDGEAALAEAGWFGEEWDKGATHPVRQKKPNAFGLYDMHGNIWEWCRDVWDAAAYRKRADGWVATEWTLPNETRRVLRGGSWRRTARGCRAADRGGDRPGDRNWGSGFRVGLVRGPSARSGTEAAPTLRDGGRGTRPQSSGGGDAADGAPDLAAAKFPPRSG
jgi:formylglycine-generating enzyme required for sulfatase activity